MNEKFIAFSGGVDSTALALIYPEAQPVFSDTGAEFPELYQHIERFKKVTGREVVRIKPALDMWQTIRKYKFFPNYNARWCTRELKIIPFNAFLESRKPCELWIGLRADENRVGNTGMGDGITLRYPLVEQGLTRPDVVKICMEHDLLPRYPAYMARGGCVNCFYKRPIEVKAMIHLVPDIVEKLIQIEEEVQDNRGKFFACFANVRKPLRTLREEQLNALFDIGPVWETAAEKNDMAEACGLFCGR